MTKSTNSYSIPAAQNLEFIIRAPSVIYSNFISVGLKSYLDNLEMTSFQCGDKSDSKRDHNLTINMVEENLQLKCKF